MNHLARTISIGLAVSLGATATATAQPLHIGALVPLTGDLQAYGETSENGIELAVKEINEAGGVLGEPIQLTSGDTQTSPQAGVDAAQRLASVDGVHAFVGALSSGVTIPVAESVSSEQGIPQISGASTSPVITDLEDNDFLFRTVPSDAFQGKALAEIAKDEGYQSLSVLHINNDYGLGLAEAFQEAFTEAGGEVPQVAAYEPGQASYRGDLRRVGRGGPEGLVLIGYPENGRTILRQAVQGGMFENFVFTDGLQDPALIEAIGAEFMNGTVGSVPQAPEGTPGAQHFEESYSAEYGEVPPQPFMDTAYDAVHLIALAAQQAGTTDSEAIRDNLRSVSRAPGEKVYPGEWEKALELLADGEEINYEGASGSVDFDDNGDVPGSFAHWEIQDGEIRNVRVFSPSE